MSNPELIEILLAEDNPQDAEMTIRALRGAGLAEHLLWVRDGVGVLDFLYRTGDFSGKQTARPKLILLDLKMPRLDGIEVLRTIKGDPGTKSIPVVMLTSSAEESDIARSYDLGVNSYVVKPVDFPKLNDEVASAGIYWLFMNRTPKLA
ncbi:MAG TPA: response regulator [Gammaproteobacteria bacterium]|nr:response regulator [Gammaproteobacteria bacterium]